MTKPTECGSPATLDELTSAYIVNNQRGEVSDQLAWVSITPFDRVFWRAVLPLSLIDWWRLDDGEEEAYVSRLAEAWTSEDPPPPVLVALHPPDPRGHVCTGLDGFHRIAAAVKAGVKFIPAWLVALDRPLV